MLFRPIGLMHAWAPHLKLRSAIYAICLVLGSILDFGRVRLFNYPAIMGIMIHYQNHWFLHYGRGTAVSYCAISALQLIAQLVPMSFHPPHSFPQQICLFLTLFLFVDWKKKFQETLNWEQQTNTFSQTKLLCHNNAIPRYLHLHRHSSRAPHDWLKLIANVPILHILIW